MSQVMFSMRQKLPTVEVLLAKIGAAGEEARSLCGGRDPRTVETQLRQFREAVHSGQGLTAASCWVKIQPLLQSKGVRA